MWDYEWIGRQKLHVWKCKGGTANSFFPQEIIFLPFFYGFCSKVTTSENTILRCEFSGLAPSSLLELLLLHREMLSRQSSRSWIVKVKLFADEALTMEVIESWRSLCEETPKIGCKGSEWDFLKARRPKEFGQPSIWFVSSVFSNRLNGWRWKSRQPPTPHLFGLQSIHKFNRK